MSGITTCWRLSIAQPEMQVSIGKLPALPQRPDRVFVRVVTVISLAEHEGDAVGAGQLARGPADDVADACFIPRGSQGSDGIEEGIADQLHISS